MSTSACSTDPDTDADDQAFLPISVDTLSPARALDFDLFIRSQPGGPAVLYRDRSYLLDDADLERLAGSGVDTLFIRTAKHLAYQRYLRETVIENDRLSPMQRYGVLVKANRAVFRSAFRSPKVDSLIAFAGEYGEQLASLVLDQAVVLTGLLPLMGHDYYTFTHSTNVSTYCLVLAKESGITDEKILADIATGALLHDAGKRSISPAILNSRSRLDEEQWRLIRGHPTAGFQELCLRDDLSQAQLMMVYQHHERLDGKGYPVGLEGEEIHLWARVCMIADVFDALSSDRPYRKRDPIAKVADMFQRRSGKEYDREIVQCLLTMLGYKS